MTSKQRHAIAEQGRTPRRLRHILGFELRDKLYTRSIRLCLVISIAAHAALLFLGGRYIDEPAPFKIIGYEGPLQLLPELSILEQQAALQEQRESREGGGMRMISYETIEQKAEVELAAAKQKDKEVDLESRFKQSSMRMLARSLPQPRSDALVLRKLIKPRYPAISLARGVEGRVILKIYITEEGKVENAVVISSNVDEHCERAAIEAALQCEFKPYEPSGKPESLWARFPVRFELAEYLLSAQPREISKK